MHDERDVSEKHRDKGVDHQKREGPERQLAERKEKKANAQNRNSLPTKLDGREKLQPGVDDGGNCSCCRGLTKKREQTDDLAR